MSLLLGSDAKLYRLTNGTRASWSATVTDGAHVGAAPNNLEEVPEIKDINIPLDFTEWDSTTRGMAPFKTTTPTLADVEIEVPMIYDPADTNCAAFLKAALTRTVIPLAFLDGDKATAGTQGLWADFSVLGMGKGEELEAGQLVTWRLKPGYSAVAPEWVKVAAA